MRRFIQIRIMLISTAAVLLTAVFCTLAYYGVFRDEVFSELKTYASLTADVLNTEVSYLQSFAEENIRLTLTDPQGQVIFDTSAHPEKLESHAHRSEIETAISAGEGRSVRQSTTIGRSNFYYAVRLEDGRILRTARESRSIYSIFYHAFPVVVILALLLLGTCFLMSRLVVRRFLEPIRRLSLNMDNPGSEPVYEELRPIMEHMRMQHQEILENAQLRQEFTANVSHELKTPLTAISGYAQLIESGMATGETSMKFVGEIRKNADRLLTLINDILRLSELDTMQDHLPEKENVDLLERARICADMLEPLCQTHGVSILVSGEHSVIRASKDMVDELIYNLCDNAIRYNRKNGSVAVTAEGPQLTVEDTGIGIPAAYQERIFERFFRVDKSRSKKTGGTGLGLAIVKHIADDCGAEIQLESEEGKGTKICVRFPD